MTTLPDDAGEVFRARPEDFVATRDALVRRLRDEGREDDAAAVKALRKPTLVVWALNQLAALAPAGVRDLLDAGRELRTAQRAAVTSGDPAGLRAATEERRRIVGELVEVAATALAGAGSGTAGQSDQIAAALETASIDPAAGALLTSGTFQTPPREPAGFGDVFGLVEIPGGRTRPAEEPVADLRSLKAEVAKLRRARDAAEKAAAAHRERATSLDRERTDLRRRLQEVDATHAEAVHEANAADTDVKRAEKALAKAEASLARRSG